MKANEESLDDENAHVQQLKKLFFDCDVDKNGCLGSKGLYLLCEKLNLTDFANDVIDRSLAGSSVVDFHSFKERFVALLPEIIDVSSGSVDPLISRAIQTARNLGLGDGQRLSRYEARLVCENTPELEQLALVDINSLYERADSSRNGRVSVQQLLQQYRLQKRLSAEVHFIADSYVASLNLFEGLDPAHTGSIDSHDLLEHWNKAGVSIDEGFTVLKQCGQPLTGMVNAIYLSAYLERELSETAADAPVAVKAAIIALHCCIDNLRCNLKELEERAEHSHKQLQLANQRRTMLIEELEHNQLSIEQSYEQRMRETEEKFRAKMLQIEEKCRTEKREMQNDVEQAEEELSRVRQLETSLRNKNTLLERQCARLNEEARDYVENMGQLEQLNRQLRSELNKAMQSRPSATDLDTGTALLWKQKMELLAAHNKRLREKIQEVTSSDSKRKRSQKNLQIVTSRWTTAFKNQVAMIRKRRMGKEFLDFVSDSETEPQAIFFRIRQKRKLKRKERRLRRDRLAARLEGASFSSGSELSMPTKSGQKTLSASQVAANSAQLSAMVNRATEEERQRLKEDMKREVAAAKGVVQKQMMESLNEQQRQLNSQFEKERRAYEAKIENERNILEREFAEEKMKIMSRLQEDFDQEIKRLAAQKSEKSSSVDHYKRQIKMLESSLEGQRNGYEKKMADLKEKYNLLIKVTPFIESDLKEKYNLLIKQQSSNPLYIDHRNTPNFLSLVEKYKNAEIQPSSAMDGMQTSPRASLNIEKRPLPATHYHSPFQRSLSSMNGRCDKCEQSECRLRELYNILCGDQTSAESGIEDLGSSAGSQIDDKPLLKKELRKLKGRLEAAKERVQELRFLASSSPTATATARYKCSLGGSEGSTEWRRPPLKWTEMTRTIERLESEKVILESRLTENQLLIKNIVEQYRKQLEGNGGATPAINLPPSILLDICNLSNNTGSASSAR